MMSYPTLRSPPLSQYGSYQGISLPLTAFGAARPQLRDTPFASDNCYSGR
jgi:hypothetical protein